MIDEKTDYSICSFKQNVYILGGRNCRILNSCFMYNMKNDRWSNIADMNERKFEADCTVYGGILVVPVDY